MPCNSEELALKSFFLGPQAENSEWVQKQLNDILNDWFKWRRGYQINDGVAISAQDLATSEFRLRTQETAKVLQELSSLFEQEIPKFSPRYIGHMFSEISLPALLGHVLTVLHNPNNISQESSIVGTQIEREAIAALGAMVGNESVIGHFTSGGTIANFEAVHRARARVFSWLALGLGAGGTRAFDSTVMGWDQAHVLGGRLDEEEVRRWSFSDVGAFDLSRNIRARTGKDFESPVLLVPEHKHYSWVKAAHLLGLGADSIWPLRLTSQGQMCLQHLEESIETAAREDRPILLVVSVLGTTELGMIDPVHRVQDLLDHYKKANGWHIWHHVDAAYGGFFASMQGQDKKIEQLFSPSSVEALGAVHRAESVTLDPHKLGYVPYASGAFICREPRDYFLRPFGGPYVDFNMKTDRGPYTIEGSRSAAGAVATWMTAKCIGLNQSGYGRIISRTILLRQEVQEKIREIPQLRLAPFCETNLLGFCLAKEGESLRASNTRTMELYKQFGEPESGFFVSKTVLKQHNYQNYFDDFIASWKGDVDTDEVVLIRLCIMNPFFKTSEMRESILDQFVRSLIKKSQELS